MGMRRCWSIERGRVREDEIGRKGEEEKRRR
jgi:hypothetical protein